MKYFRYIPTAAVLIASLSACDLNVERGPEVGQMAPAYGALTVDGDSIHLADLEDEVVLLNIWATWCPPCRAEIPDLQALHERLNDRGLHIVGVSIDAEHDRSSVLSFSENLGVTYSIWLDPADLIRTRFRVVGVPTTLLIGRDGEIVWKHIGPLTDDNEELNGAIESALSASAS